MAEEEEEVKVEEKTDISANMDVFECIATRRSIRKFMELDVPMEMLGAILDAGRYAPSSGNVQNWRFIIVKNKDTIQKIAEAAMQQLWIGQAPAVIVVCSDSEKLQMFYGTRGERLYAIQNCAASIQNMLLAAHAIGLAGCWVGAFDEAILSRVLSIPENVRPQAIIPIGYPDEIVPTPMHYTLESLCFLESYGSRIVNIKRVLQNPDVGGRLSDMIKGVVDASKDIVDKAKSKLKKK